MRQEEQLRLLRHLDYQAGLLARPAASVGVADLGWLKRLDGIVDLDAVLLPSASALIDLPVQAEKREPREEL